MQDMKKLYLITVVTSIVVVAVFWAADYINKVNSKSKESIRIGFVYDCDESTPYTANFIKAQKELERKFGDKVEIFVQNNIRYADDCEKSLDELVAKGCDVVFTTSEGYGETAKRYAEMYPDIEFCQATCSNANEAPFCENYHTFMGEIYQGRYISGVIAGMKISEMIADGEITPEQAKVGYVAAFSCDEVISGYTAFFLGVREMAPTATMEVKYTDTWSNYAVEKACAEQLIADGCIIISQHSDTTGPAVACEEMFAKRRVYHIGYNQSMIDVAPTSSIIGSRINWSPYFIGVCEALLEGKKIEETIEGDVHGNDIGAGFDKGWIEMLELNSLIAAKGSEEKIQELEKAFKKGKIDVFKGDYIGVDPNDPSNTYDLSKGFIENENASAPSFGYVLKDVIRIID